MASTGRTGNERDVKLKLARPLELLEVWNPECAAQHCDVRILVTRDDQAIIFHNGDHRAFQITSDFDLLTPIREWTKSLHVRASSVGVVGDPDPINPLCP